MDRRRVGDSQDPAAKRQKLEVREEAGWGPIHRGGRGRGWGRSGGDGQGRGFMSDGRGHYGRGDFASVHHERGGCHRGGRHGGGFQNNLPFMHPVGHPGAHGILDAQHQVPMPPQQQQLEEGHRHAVRGHQQGMHGDGSKSGHVGQHLVGGPPRGRGRGWGHGGGSSGLQPFRRGQAVLDPAVLERRRKSTAAIVARQLSNVHVSEGLAGQKGYLHYQRSLSAMDDNQERATKKGSSEEEIIKLCLMSSAVASEEDTSSGVRAHDPSDAFELCLDDYTMSMQDSSQCTGASGKLELQTSKFGTFLAPRTWCT